MWMYCVSDSGLCVLSNSLNLERSRFLWLQINLLYLSLPCLMKATDSPSIEDHG